MVSTYKKHSSTADQGSQQSGTSLKKPRKQQKKNGKCVQTERECKCPVTCKEGLRHLSPTAEMAGSLVHR